MLPCFIKYVFISVSGCMYALCYINYVFESACACVCLWIYYVYVCVFVCLVFISSLCIDFMQNIFSQPESHKSHECHVTSSVTSLSCRFKFPASYRPHGGLEIRSSNMDPTIPTI